MAELDDIVHQPLRLKVMAALNALPSGVGLEFARLKKLTGTTDGNLGAHIETLAKAGYVSVEKAFVGKKPQTTVTAAAAGGGGGGGRGGRGGGRRRPGGAGLLGMWQGCRRSWRGSSFSLRRHDKQTPL